MMKPRTTIAAIQSPTCQRRLSLSRFAASVSRFALSSAMVFARRAMSVLYSACMVFMSCAPQGGRPARTAHAASARPSWRDTRTGDAGGQAPALSCRHTSVNPRRRPCRPGVNERRSHPCAKMAMCKNGHARERPATTAIAALRIPRRAQTLKSRQSRHYEAMPIAIPPIIPDSGIETWTGGLPAYPALVRWVPPR